MPKRSPHVLVVDDESSMRELYEALLSGAGYAVSYAANGVEALDHIARHAPDAMVLDLSMAKLDGFGVLKALSQSERQIRTLVVTARHDALDIEQAIALGASDYLAKPFDPTQFRARLARLTRHVA